MDELLAWLRATIEGDKALAETIRVGGFQAPEWRAERARSGRWMEIINDARSPGEGPKDPPCSHSIGYMTAGRGEYAHVVRHDPRDTTARCEGELALLDDLLAEEHFLNDGEWYGCRSLKENPAGDGPDVPTGRPCTCGRDERVERRVRRLAYGYRFRPGWKEEWKP